MENTARLAAEFRKVSRTADRQCSMHGRMRDYYSLCGLALNLLTLLLSVILLSVVWCPDAKIQMLLWPVNFKGVGGFAAILNFSLIIVDLVWRPNTKAQDHDQAARRYQRISHDIDRLLSSGAQLTSDRLKQAWFEYSDNRDLPPIAGYLQLTLERLYELQTYLSDEVRTSPHLPIWWLRLRLLWRGCTPRSNQPALDAPAFVEPGAGKTASDGGNKGNGQTRPMSKPRETLGDESPVLDTEAESKE